MVALSSLKSRLESLDDGFMRRRPAKPFGSPCCLFLYGRERAWVVGFSYAPLDRERLRKYSSEPSSISLVAVEIWLGSLWPSAGARAICLNACSIRSLHS